MNVFNLILVWVKDSKYIVAYLTIYLQLIFLPKSVKKFLQNRYIQILIVFFMNMSIGYAKIIVNLLN
jgi:hypothetical protein